MKGVVIQPHFMPWLGYLSIVNACDKFVFYDDVQYSREGWYRRNRVLNSFKKEPVFINAPVVSKSNTLIKDILFEPNKGLDLVENQLNSSYNLLKRDDEGARFVKRLLVYNDDMIRKGSLTLSELNLSILEMLCEYLEIKTEIVVSSSLNIPSEDRYLRVPLICEKLGITEYYNGQASKDYMKSDEDYSEYTKRNIKYNYWSYKVPEYKHFTDSVFHPRLSSLDAILSLPREEVKKLIEPCHLELEG